MRANSSVWKMAEWIYTNLPEPLVFDSWSPFELMGEKVRNDMYDKAVELLHHIGPNGVFEEVK